MFPDIIIAILSIATSPGIDRILERHLSTLLWAQGPHSTCYGLLVPCSLALPTVFCLPLPDDLSSIRSRSERGGEIGGERHSAGATVGLTSLESLKWACYNGTKWACYKGTENVKYEYRYEYHIYYELPSRHAANMSYGTGPMARSSARNMDDGWMATGSKRMNRVFGVRVRERVG